MAVVDDTVTEYTPGVARQLLSLGTVYVTFTDVSVLATAPVASLAVAMQIEYVVHAAAVVRGGR